MVTTLGICAPGAMGSAIGACAVATGHRVVWASQGRSRDTVARAEEDGLTDVGDLGALLETSDVVLSVCPPHAAVDVAAEIAAHGYAGTVIDANAISPATMGRVQRTLASGGATVVDASIVGPPPRGEDRTRLFLAGAGAERFAALFPDAPLHIVDLHAAPPAASALKMAYAAWSKGSAGLLFAVRAYASHAGVEDALLDEWERSQPDLAERSDRQAADAGPKAWRWVAEMEEIAATLDDASLPDGFHHAAAEVFHRLRGHRGGPPPAIEDVVADLLDPPTDD